jgi:hypothetical protein
MIHKKINTFLKLNITNYNTWKYNKREYLHLARLFNIVRRKDLLHKTIVFNTVRSFKNIFDRELFLAKLLALNGANVIVLLDDDILKHWDSIKVDRVKKLKRIDKKEFNLFPNIQKFPGGLLKVLFDRNILNQALKVYQDQNLTILYYSDIVKKVDFTNWQELKKFAKSSTIRFFKNSELNFKEHYVKYYYNLSLLNSLISRTVGKYILHKIKPDFFITSHGIYSTWGPAFEFLKKKGIKSYVYAGKHSHSKDVHDIYVTDSKVQTLSRSKFWDEFKSIDVTKLMENKVREIFKARMNHSTKDTQIYYTKKINRFIVDKNDRFKYHIAIFPNLIWDGNIEDRHIAFKGIMDWIISTVNYLKKKKEIKIYIKFHPAEVTLFKGTPKIQDLLKNNLNLEDFENLVLIPSEANIDPYQFLLSGIDYAIVYDGILGLEIPFLKIPTLLGCVGGRFSVKGGNFTINSRKDYFNYLDNLKDDITEFHENYQNYYKTIIKYSYWYFFANVIKLPTLSSKSLYGTDLMHLRVEDIVLDEKIFKIFK